MMFNQKKYILKFDKDVVDTKDVLNNFEIKLYNVKDPIVPKIEYGYDIKLNEYRNNIDNIDNEIWKKIRWYINDYDFVVKEPIINRAFYKYWEIINKFNIFEEYDVSDLILHCAEAPGGFIQGTNLYLQIEKSKNISKKMHIDNDGFTVVNKNNKRNRQHRIYTISLNKECLNYKHFNLPSYNKIVMNKYICLTYGDDNTGDINNINNIDSIYKKSLNTFYLITGDGGFDEGCNFNNKEQLHYKLILHEVYSAIRLQSINGHFILKMFDIFTDTSIHILYLLSLCYKEVYIYKPITSRPTNSEKYIICKYFNCSNDNRELYIDRLTNLSQMFKQNDENYISFTLFKHIPNTFIECVTYINKDLLDKQCSFLDNAIQLCNNQEFLSNYNEFYTTSINRRKDVFKQWEAYYNLNAYI